VGEREEETAERIRRQAKVGARGTDEARRAGGTKKGGGDGGVKC